MSYYIIEGGKKLEGEVKISGSKNASLPIIAATILNGKKSKIYNVPNIHDMQITLKYPLFLLLENVVPYHSNKLHMNHLMSTNKHVPYI